MARRPRAIRVEWAPTAMEDLEAIHDHVSEDSPREADRLIGRLAEAAMGLERWPMRGRHAAMLAPDDPSIREILVGPYRVVYVVDGRVVRVLHFRHGARGAPGGAE